MTEFTGDEIEGLIDKAREENLQKKYEERKLAGVSFKGEKKYVRVKTTASREANRIASKEYRARVKRLKIAYAEERRLDTGEGLAAEEGRLQGLYGIERDKDILETLTEEMKDAKE